MKELKIAIVKTSLLLGSGQVVHIKELAKRMEEMGHKVTVYSRVIKTNLDEIKIVNIKAPLDKIPFVRHFTFVASCLNLLKESDVIHTQYHPAIFTGNLAKSIYGKPHVYTYHGFAPTSLWREPKQKLKMTDHRVGLFLALRGNVDRIITVSNFLARELVNQYHVNPGIIRVIHNGVDLNRFKPGVNAEYVRKKLNLGNDPIVLYVGRLAPYKGVQFLLEAVPFILREHPTTKIVVAGSPRYDSPLIGHLIKKKDVRKAVIFSGYVEDAELPLYYAASDIFCFPSMWEGFGLPMAEAQACGKPVVAFNHCAMPEVVSNGKTGMLVSSGNSYELAEAMNRILSDNSLRINMSRDARLRAEKLFRWDSATEATLKVYEEVS